MNLFKKILYSLTLPLLLGATSMAMKEENVQWDEMLLGKSYSSIVDTKNNSAQKTAKQVCQHILAVAERELKLGNLYWLDANIGNDQCHWSSLYIAELYNKTVILGQNLSPDEKNYLGLSLMLSTCVANNKHKDKLVNLYASFGDKNSGKFRSFLNNPRIILQAKKRCNELLYSFTMKSILEEKTESTNDQFKAILEEIAETITKKKDILRLTEEDKTTGTCRIPKIMGIFPWLLRVNRLKFPVICKIKIMHESDMHLCVLTGKKGQENLPAMVIEGVSSSITFGEYVECRNGCIHNLWNFDYPRTSHSCRCCIECLDGNKCNVFANQKKNIDGLDLHKIILSIAASFSNTFQKKYVNEIILKTTYIRKLFEEALVFSQKNGLCYEDPSCFVIEHIHTDIGGRVMEKKRLVDMNWTETLNNLYKQ